MSGLRDINFAELIQLPCEYYSGIQVHGFLSPESGYVGHPRCSSLLLTFSLQGQAFVAMKGDFFLEKKFYFRFSLPGNRNWPGGTN